MAKIRCFIGLDFPNEIIKEVAKVQEQVSKIQFTGKQTELENLHLTLKFLGEIDEKYIGEIVRRLNKIDFKIFPAQLGEIGIFNFKSNPKIVWIKINGKDIWELQEKIDESLIPIFRKEERFMSHLTITRLKYIKDKINFIKRVKSISVKPISFQVKNFSLFKSELRLSGPVYKKIKEFKLK